MNVLEENKELYGLKIVLMNTYKKYYIYNDEPLEIYCS